MFYVRCPICRGKLLIDDNAKKVVEHIAKEDADTPAEKKLENILDRLRSGKEERDAKLARAKEKEAERRKRSEDLFREAQKKVKEKGDEGPPPGPVWD